MHCGQSVGRIKIKLGMQVDLGPGHIVLDDDPALPPQRGTAPQFSAHICRGQMVTWIKMPLGTDISLGPGRHLCVRRGPRSPLPQRGAQPPIFSPCLLWPNGWMDEAATWHGARPQPRRLCVTWRPSPPPTKGGGAPSPIFGPFLLWPNGWMHQDATWYGGRP